MPFDKHAFFVDKSCMNCFARRLVGVGVILYVLACGFEIITGREHWPFSPYPMFSRVEESTTLERFRAVGIPADPSWTSPHAKTYGGHLLEADQIQPFHFIRLDAALDKLHAQSDGPAKLQLAAANLLQRYESRRQLGEHTGPPLRGLRLVRAEWDLRRDAANHAKPERLQMLVTVELESSTLPTPQDIP